MTEPTEQIQAASQAAVPGPAAPETAAPLTSPDQPPPRPPRPGRDTVSILIGAGAVVLVLAFAAVAFGAGRLTAPGALHEGTRWGHDAGKPVARPADRPADGRARDLRDRLGRALRGMRDLRADLPRDGLRGLRGATITAIDATTVTVESEGGWTLTVTVTDETTLLRAGDAISLADLEVGDRVVVRAVRQDDGTVTAGAIHVILPRVTGRVTETAASSITIQRRDGTTMSIVVDAETTIRVRGVADPTTVDISVGMVVVAIGTENDDGSLQALAIWAAMPG
jgi:hypothetical protein